MQDTSVAEITRYVKQCASLIEYYEDLVRKQPEVPTWQSGLRAALAWKELLEQPNPTTEQIRLLVRYAVPHRMHSGSAWSFFCMCLAEWAQPYQIEDAKFLTRPGSAFPELDNAYLDWLRSSLGMPNDLPPPERKA